MDSARIVEEEIRKLLQFRMSLIPYLYNAFADYHFKGIPPFRALVVDYPEDKNTFTISNEYLIGNGILAAPLTADETSRSVYLPAGLWYDFNTNQKFTGGKVYTIQPSNDQLPIFVKEGTILPLAKPVEHISADTQFEITCYVYGNKDTRGSLFEDDGESFDYEQGRFTNILLSWTNHHGTVTRSGAFKSHIYNITKWQLIE